MNICSVRMYVYMCACMCAHNRMSDPKMNLYVCMYFMFSNLRAVSEN